MLNPACLLRHGGNLAAACKLYANLEYSEDKVASVINLADTWHPELDLDDDLLLASWMVHRASTTLAMWALRSNLNIRFAATPSVSQARAGY